MGAQVSVLALRWRALCLCNAFAILLQAMAAANAANAMKLAGVLVGGPAVFLVSIQGTKLFRNATSTADDNKADNITHLRNQGVVDRLQTGHFSEKHLERTLKTNSAMRHKADELRGKSSKN